MLVHTQFYGFEFGYQQLLGRLGVPLRQGRWSTGFRRFGFHRLRIEPLEARRLLTYVHGFGTDPGEQSEVMVVGSLASSTATETYEFHLNKGDVWGAAVTHLDATLRVVGPGGSVLIETAGGTPHGIPDSPLNYKHEYVNGDEVKSAIQLVAVAAGEYTVEVTDQAGAFDLYLQAFRPYLETQPKGAVQYVYLDFGEIHHFNPSEVFLGSHVTDAYVAPFADFVPGMQVANRLPLTSSDVNPLINKIIATVEENFHEIALTGGNGNRDGVFNQPLGSDGEFAIKVLNSRDHADVWGMPNVSRVIMGGTTNVMNLGGIAQSFDVGNLDTTEIAVVGGNFWSLLNTPTIPPGVSVVDAIGEALGNIVSHETGHLFQGWHTLNNNLTLSIMDPGAYIFDMFGDPTEIVDVDFVADSYTGTEYSLVGTNNVPVNLAFGLSTGKGAGTLNDWVPLAGSTFQYIAGALQYTGNSAANNVNLTMVPSGLQVTYDGQTQVFANVSEFVFKGNDGNDTLTVDSSVTIPIKAFGGRGDDVLQGGMAADVLDGGSGADTFHVVSTSQNHADQDTVVDHIIRNEHGIYGDANTVEFSGNGWVQMNLWYNDLNSVVLQRKSGMLDFGNEGIAGGQIKMMEAAIDELFRVAAGPFDLHAAQFDFNGDQTVDDLSDVDANDTDTKIFIEEILGTFFGDATLDGRVEANDMTVVGQHWLMNAFIEHWGVGDMNGDGVVDVQDLSLMGLNWQKQNGNW